MKNLIKLLLPIALFISCEASKGVEVLATTSVVADAARQLLPPEVEVQALMQSNIDPHSYKPIERMCIPLILQKSSCTTAFILREK